MHMTAVCKCVAKAVFMSVYCAFSCFWNGVPSRAMRTQRVFLPSLLGTHQQRKSFILQASNRKNNNQEKQQKKQKKNSFEINPTWKQDFDAAALSESFDRLAKLDGFDESTIIEGGEQRGAWKEEDVGSTRDFVILDDDGSDDIICFDSSYDDDDVDYTNDDMDQRIAMAKRDQVYVPQELDQFSSTASTDVLQQIGFRRELNPFGRDETPRKANSITVVQNAMQCTACGSDFQNLNPQKPGYLPSDKYDIQLKLSKVEKAQQLQAKMEANEWTAEEEIEWLLNDKANNNSNPSNIDTLHDNLIDIPTLIQDLGLEDHINSGKKVICKRCHGLQNFGVVENALRPGWSEEPSISQEAFQRMLAPLATKKAVIIALVDLFDFSGSVLPQLDSIAGESNPVLIAANKADLFPSKMGQLRAENWVRRELEYLGIQCLANVGGAVRLVSCKTGFGIQSLLSKARDLAEEMECDIYLIGAANAGKSTLINRITSSSSGSIAATADNLDTTQANDRAIKSRPGNVNAKKGLVTTSPLPGTTLKFIKFDIGEGKSLYDTPGLLIPGSLTQRLTAEELKLVVPKKEIEPITFRVASGKCVLIGGLAQIEVVGDSKPFLITFYVSNDVKLHPTDSSKAREFREKHVGELLTPPLGDGRIDEIGEMESHALEIEGSGWKEAAADIAIRGLGWMAVTGAGLVRLRVTVPKGVGISVRPPIMPFDVWESTARFTGGRAVRKSGRSVTGKRRSGVGRK